MTKDETEARLAEIEARREESLDDSITTHEQAVLIVDDLPWLLELVDNQQE